MTRKLVPIVVGVVLSIGLAVCAALGLAYWSLERSLADGIRQLKSAVTHDFLDPSSARFRDLEHWSSGDSRFRLLRLLDPDTYRLWISAPDLLRDRQSSVLAALLTHDVRELKLCGEVNAKNRLGAYTGFRKFYIDGNFPEPILDVGSRSEATIMCGSLRSASPPTQLAKDPE